MANLEPSGRQYSIQDIELIEAQRGQRSGGGGGGGIILLLILAGAAVGGGWYAWTKLEAAQPATAESTTPAAQGSGSVPFTGIVGDLVPLESFGIEVWQTGRFTIHDRGLDAVWIHGLVSNQGKRAITISEIDAKLIDKQNALHDPERFYWLENRVAKLNPGLGLERGWIFLVPSSREFPTVEFSLPKNTKAAARVDLTRHTPAIEQRWKEEEILKRKDELERLAQMDKADAEIEARAIAARAEAAKRQAEQDRKAAAALERMIADLETKLAAAEARAAELADRLEGLERAEAKDKKDFDAKAKKLKDAQAKHADLSAQLRAQDAIVANQRQVLNRATGRDAVSARKMLDHAEYNRRLLAGKVDDAAKALAEARAASPGSTYGSKASVSLRAQVDQAYAEVQRLTNQVEKARKDLEDFYPESESADTAAQDSEPEAVPEIPPAPPQP